jgi:hypothetical protein
MVTVVNKFFTVEQKQPKAWLASGLKDQFS